VAPSIRRRFSPGREPLSGDEAKIPRRSQPESALSFLAAVFVSAELPANLRNFILVGTDAASS